MKIVEFVVRSNLSAQAKPEAVSKASGHVVEHTSAVNFAQEVLCCVLVLCTETEGSVQHTDAKP